jgi:hypothetical protein
MKVIDEDQSGTIDRMEWVEYLSSPGGGEFNYELKELYDMYDNDKDGVISIEEFQKIIVATFKQEIERKTENGQIVATKVIESLAMELFVALDENGEG